MTEKIPAPLFGVGDHVIVHHPQEDDWMGYVSWRSYTGDAWEYEVTGAPRWRAATNPGDRWRPLAWESELERVKK